MRTELAGERIQIEFVFVLGCIEAAVGKGLRKILAVISEDIIRLDSNGEFFPKIISQRTVKLVHAALAVVIIVYIPGSGKHRRIGLLGRISISD